MHFLSFLMFRAISILFVAGLLSGCEQLDGLVFGGTTPEKSAVPEETTPENAAPEEPLPEREIAEKPAPTLPEQPVRPKPGKPERPTPPAPVKPQPPSRPVQPTASAELLRIVNNWQGIPDSAFPRQVALVRPLSIGFRDSSGNSTGTTTYPAGHKLFACDQVGNYVHLAPSKSSSLRALVGLDHTNLKQVLIYAYEMTKLRQSQLAMTGSPIAVSPRPRPNKPSTKPRPTTSGSGAKPTPKPRPTPRPGKKPSKPNAKDAENFLFDDLPEPKDFGHGQWCVCRDCRKRRISRR